jgi:hypothetical protein
MTYQAWFAKALVTMTIAILVSGGLFAGTAAHAVSLASLVAASPTGILIRAA